MKKYVLKSWVKKVLVGLLIILLVAIFHEFNKSTEDAINNCIDNGNTRAFCEKGIIG